MHVSGKYLFALFLSVVFLAGCKEPSIEVSSLGKKLPAPMLKGTSPFDQNFDLQGYSRVQGVCDNRVGDVFVSFDNINWIRPPASPDISGTSLTDTGVTNDFSCTDGAFDIYLTNNDLKNIWNFQPGPSTKISIYIKGQTLIGDTDVLILTEPDPKPAKITLFKSWPNGFAGGNQCESFHVQLQDDTGRRVMPSADISFNLENLISGTVNSNISAFTSFQDCSNNNSPTSNFVFFANTDHVDIYYRFPSAPIDGTLSFRVINPSSLSADPNYTVVVLRDSSTAATHQWLAVENFSYQLYKNTCYPLTIRSYKYNRSLSYESGIIKPTSSPEFLFFTDSTCSVLPPSGEFAITATDSSTIIYVKYVPSGAETNSFVPATLSLTGSSASGALYDFKDMNFSIDLTAVSTATQLEMWGPQNLTTSICAKYSIITMNKNHTWIPVSGITTVNLSTDPGTGNFYTSPTCDAIAPAPITSTLSVAANSLGGDVYFKPAAAAPLGSHQFKFSATGFMDLIRNWFLN